MNVLIQNWLDIESKLDELRDASCKAEKLAQTAPLPEKLRSATAKDIVEDAIIWYPDHRDDDEESPSAGWHLVSEVHQPSDEWKAYTDYLGCRYGLAGAFVEI